VLEPLEQWQKFEIEEQHFAFEELELEKHK